MCASLTSKCLGSPSSLLAGEKLVKGLQGLVFKLLGVVILSGLQLYRLLTTTSTGYRREVQVEVGEPLGSNISLSLEVSCSELLVYLF